MFGGHYLENGWRYSLGFNRAPIGNNVWGIKWSHDRWRRVTLKGQVVTQIYLDANISKTLWDRDLATMDNQWEIAYIEPIGHLIDHVTWPWKVNIVTLKCLGPIVSKTAKDIDSVTIEHLANGVWGIKWPHDRWCQWSVNRDLGMFGRERGSLEKSHGIGHTSCSYERYVVY